MIINFASLGSSGGGSSSAATYEAAVLCAQTYTDIQVSGISSDVLIVSGVTNNLSGVTVGLVSQINEVEEVSSIALNDLNDRVEILSGIPKDVLRVSSGFISGDAEGDLRSIQDKSIWWNGTDASVNIDIYIAESYFTTLTGSGRTNSTYIGSIIYNNVASSNSSLHLYLEKLPKNYLYPDHEYYLMGYDGNGTTMDLYLPLDMNGVTGRTLSTSNVTYYFSNSYSDGLSHISFSGTGSNIGVLTNPLTIKEEGVYVKGASHNTRLIDEETYESATQAISVALNDLNNTKVSSTDIRNIVKMTQAQYDALSGNTEATTLYVITSN